MFNQKSETFPQAEPDQYFRWWNLTLLKLNLSFQKTHAGVFVSFISFLYFFFIIRFAISKFDSNILEVTFMMIIIMILLKENVKNILSIFVLFGFMAYQPLLII